MVNGITFSEQLTTSADFAHFQNTFLNRSNGVTKGCGISHADGNVYVQKGYFVIAGRFVRVVGVETIPTPDVLSGQLYCKVAFEVDLTKVNTPEEFGQGYFRVLSSADGYPALTQEDLDADGTLYQMPWCQFVKGVDGIHEFRDLREILNLESIWAAVARQNTEYKGEFDAYFANQRAVVEQMIKELEGQGYVKVKDYDADMAKIQGTADITLPAAGWSNAAPYKQTVQVPGVLATDVPIIGLSIADGATAEDVKLQAKAWGCVDRAVTGDGTITFYCYNKLPAVDFTVQAKGVCTNG